jgi:CheY-like chemotaxis protein
MKAILIVDDDAASLALVEGVLEAEGYETRKAPEMRRVSGEADHGANAG